MPGEKGRRADILARRIPPVGELMDAEPTASQICWLLAPGGGGWDQNETIQFEGGSSCPTHPSP